MVISLLIYVNFIKNWFLLKLRHPVYGGRTSLEVLVFDLGSKRRRTESRKVFVVQTEFGNESKINKLIFILYRKGSSYI